MGVRKRKCRNPTKEERREVGSSAPVHGWESNGGIGVIRKAANRYKGCITYWATILARNGNELSVYLEIKLLVYSKNTFNHSIQPRRPPPTSARRFNSLSTCATTQTSSSLRRSNSLAQAPDALPPRLQTQAFTAGHRPSRIAAPEAPCNEEVVRRQITREQSGRNPNPEACFIGESDCGL